MKNSLTQALYDVPSGVKKVFLSNSTEQNNLSQITMLRTLRTSEPELIRMCKKKSWDSVETRLLANPAGAMLSDFSVVGEGSTALSSAIRSRAPLKVIQGLLEANGEQISVTDTVRGSALHDALRHGAYHDVLQFLVEKITLHDRAMSVHNLSYHSILGAVDDLGRTALHYMVDRILRAIDQGEQTAASWELLQKLVQSFPQATSMVDADGTTPLVMLLLIPNNGFDTQECVLEEAIYHMVRLMLALHPHAVRVARRLPRPWHFHFVQVGSPDMLHGNGVPSPLSCALLHGRSPCTVDLLLEANRRVDTLACRTIVTHYREVPLHIASSMRCQPSLIKRLIQEDSEVLDVEDSRGLTPFDWMWVRHVLDWCSSRDVQSSVTVSRRRYIHTSFMQWHQRVSHMYLGKERDFEEAASESFREMRNALRCDLLDRMLVFLIPLAHQKMSERNRGSMMDTEEKMTLVHAAAMVPCPLAMLQLACDAYPDQLWTKDSSMGRLPLHYACSRGGYQATYPIGASCSLHRIEETSPLERIASLYPTAARVSDSLGQLPLHIAIDHVKAATCKSEAENYEGEQKKNFTGIDTLLANYPESLHRRDGKSRLYPFQQAATGTNGDIELTFLLLRRDPSLLLPGR